MNRAHTMPSVYPIVSSGSLHGSVARRKDDGLSLLGGQHFTTGLGARALFHEQKLATGKIPLVTAEKHGELQRKRDVPIEVLMEAVVPSGGVVEQQRGGLRLAMLMTDREQLIVARRKIARLTERG